MPGKKREELTEKQRYSREVESRIFIVKNAAFDRDVRDSRR